MHFHINWNLQSQNSKFWHFTQIWENLLTSSQGWQIFPHGYHILAADCHNTARFYHKNGYSSAHRFTTFHMRQISPQEMLHHHVQVSSKYPDRSIQNTALWSPRSHQPTGQPLTDLFTEVSLAHIDANPPATLANCHCPVCKNGTRQVL